MIKKFCGSWGLLAFAIICIFPIISVRSYIEPLIGEGAINSILSLFMIYTFLIALTQFSKIFARFAVGGFILFLTLIVLILGNSSLPEKQLERARARSRQLITVDKSQYKNDRQYADAVDASQREEKARQLEVEIAELRDYGQFHSYGIKPWMKFLFISCIGLMFVYGICWIILGNRWKDIENCTETQDCLPFSRPGS
jgi:hypothetical protein